MAPAVRERLLNQPIQRDLDRQGGVAQCGIDVGRHGFFPQTLAVGDGTARRLGDREIGDAGQGETAGDAAYFIERGAQGVPQRGHLALTIA